MLNVNFKCCALFLTLFIFTSVKYVMSAFIFKKKYEISFHFQSMLWAVYILLFLVFLSQYSWPCVHGLGETL